MMSALEEINRADQLERKLMAEHHPGLKSKHNQANSLVQQMTTAEKASLCSGKSFWFLEGVKRLAIEPVMVTDGPHGLRKQNTSADHVGLNKSVPATCFPTAVTLASTWNTDLLEEIGVALGEQCIAEDVTVLLGPGLNIKRHPLCGRNFEYFSEDPLLSGKLAAAMVRGVQSQGVGTSIKHYAVNNQENGRMILDAVVDERTLREIYLRGFEIAVREAQPWTVMCAYNRVNGTYCSEHNWLLNTVLRDEWGFEGLVVTDWGAANDRVSGVASGLDLEMPSSGGMNDARVLRAVETGQLDEQILDQAVTRNVALNLLGQDVAEAEVDLDQQAHHNLARRAASEGAVLLKNDDQVLPLSPEQSIAVIGAFAKSPRYQGAGSSQVNPVQLENTWTALTEHTDSLLYAPGYDAKAPVDDPGLIADAVKAAKQADVALVFAGLPSIYESEAFDRNHLDLPPQHNRLIEAVCAANPNTVVVLFNGSPVSMPWRHQPKAILEAYLAGQAGGTAIADLLYGAANPSGKLAETFPLAMNDLISDQFFPGTLRQVLYCEGLAVGYRQPFAMPTRTPTGTGALPEPMYAFGYGLSYTEFSYTQAKVEIVSESPLRVVVSTDVTNCGSVEGAEVVQFYVHARESCIYRADQTLASFSKVFLDPGETKQVQVELDERAFAIYDTGAQDWLVEAGTYDIRISASSIDCRQTVSLDLAGNGTLSEDAQRRYPVDYLEQLQSDPLKTFASALGHPIPTPEPSQPFHTNSSVGELTSTWLGRKVRRRIMEMFMGNMGVNANDQTLNKMMSEMANNMPLRGISMFSRGKLPFHVLDMLIAMLNHQPGRAIQIWAQYKIDQQASRTEQ